MQQNPKRWLMGKVIRIKPHHFIDIITALGRGETSFEPHPYGHAVHTVAASLLKDRDAMLEMELGADDICQPCKHNKDGLCDDTIDTSFRPDAPSSKRLYNLTIDQRWCQRLSLKQGDRITAREFCQRLDKQTDDISDIYRENPNRHSALRKKDLRAGIIKFQKEENPP
jgi:hypothetical protein